MLVAIVVAAALLGQAPPAPEAPAGSPGDPAIAPPPPESSPGPIPAAQAAPEATLPEDAPHEPPPAKSIDEFARDASVELGVLVAPHAGPGDLDGVLTAGVDALKWRLGPAHLGLRLGALLAGTSGDCPEDVECAFAGFYVGPLVRVAPLHGKAVSPWVEVGATPFLATGMEFDDETLAGIELPRISAGLDVTAGKLRIGVSGFHSRTFFSGPISDGGIVMWGSTLRFMWSEL